MKTILCLLLFINIVSSTQAQDEGARRKAARNTEILEVLKAVHKKAELGYDEKKAGEIRALIPKRKDEDFYFSLAFSFYGLLHPQNGDESYDFVVDTAMWTSIDRLGSFPTEQATKYLKELQNFFRRGAGPSEILAEILEAQAKLIKEKGLTSASSESR